MDYPRSRDRRDRSRSRGKSDRPDYSRRGDRSSDGDRSRRDPIIEPDYSRRRDRSSDGDRSRREQIPDRGSSDRADSSRRRDRSSDGDRSKREEIPDPDSIDDVFSKGRTVMLKGLQKNPEKNGTIGTLVEFNQDKGRWVVSLSAGNTNLKEENMELMPDNSDVVDEKQEPPTAKIYITHLAASTKEKDLVDLFGAIGKIAKQKQPGRGFEDQWPYAVKLYKPGRDDGDACVEYMDPQAAKFAIKTYNRFKFKGNRIGVAYAGQGKTFEAAELQLPWHLREENQGKLETKAENKSREVSWRGEGGKGFGMKGDWVCQFCEALVYRTKEICYKCGGEKPENPQTVEGKKDDTTKGRDSK